VCEQTVIGLDRVVGILLNVVPGRGDEVIVPSRVDSGGVGDRLADSPSAPTAPGEKTVGILV
jgi:hypothetical protein